MGLNIVTEAGGDFTPWVKYNAKAGRWYIKGENGDVEVTAPVFVADFANIQTGWFYFSAGQAPERVMDASLEAQAPRPEHGDFKRGFALNVFSNDSFNGVVELSATSAALCSPINDLYEAYESAPEAKEGKLPVVAFVRADPVTGKHGTNYAPVFEIQKWVDAPAELKDASSNAPVAANNAESEAAPVAVAAAGGSEF